MCARRCTRRWWPHPSSARSTWPASGSCCASPRWPSPIRSGAGGPPRCTGTWARRPPTSGATPRPTGTGGAAGGLARPDRALCAGPDAQRCRATRWRWPASRWSGRRRCSTPPAASAPTAARALLAGTAAHSMEPLTAPLTSAFALLLTALGHGAGWPVVAGGSAAITAGSGQRAAPAGRRGAHRRPGRVTGRAAAGPGRAARHLAPGVRGAGRGPALPPGRPALGALQARCRDLQGRLGARRPGAVVGGGLPAHRDRPRRRHVRRGGPLARRRCRRGATPSSPSSWWPSPASSTRPGRRRASTRCGPTATCPTDPTST